MKQHPNSRSSHLRFLCGLALALSPIGAGLAVFSLAATGNSPYMRPGITDRVSVASNGNEANADAENTPAISANGRHVAFETRASNLEGSAVGTSVFVRDRAMGTTERVSITPAGTPGNDSSFTPAISADGRFVAFVSLARNLVTPPDTNGYVWDAFLHDRTTRTNERISVASDGTESDGNAQNLGLSADGRVVAFESYGTNLVPGDTNVRNDIFVRDRAAQTTERVSVASDGAQSNNHSFAPVLSADGGVVAFHSSATNLVPDDTNGRGDVFAHDRATGITTRVSVASDGAEGDNLASSASISADGRYIAFASTATNFVPNDINVAQDIFVHDRVTGITERVSIASDGTEANGWSYFPSISADGRYVAFPSLASNLIPDDNNAVYDVFVHDRATRVTARVSVASHGGEGTLSSIHTEISADGRHVAFGSTATDLVDNDGNGVRDIFVHDRGETVGIVGTPNISCAGDNVNIAGRATFSGAIMVAVDDASNDGTGGAAALGGELTGAALIYRPENGDLLFRLRVLSLPPVGAPGVLYGFRFQLASTNYEVRAQSVGNPSAGPYFGLFQCESSCTEVALLTGGIGTAGEEVLVAVPLATLGATEGTALTGLAAYSAFGANNTGPGIPLDEVALPATALARALRRARPRAHRHRGIRSCIRDTRYDRRREFFRQHRFRGLRRARNLDPGVPRRRLRTGRFLPDAFVRVTR